MPSEQPTSQTTWHEGIDVDLAARLLTATSEPGVVSMRLCRRLLGWVEYLELRRALATSIAQRWASTGHLRAPDHPIVHAGWISDLPADTASPGPRAALPGALQRSISRDGANPPKAGSAASNGEPRRMARGEPVTPAPLAPLLSAREAPTLVLVHARPVPLSPAHRDSPSPSAQPVTTATQPVSGASPLPTATSSIQRAHETGVAPLRDPSTSRPASARADAAVKLGRAVEPMEKAIARGLADSMRAGVSRTRASRSGVVSPTPETPSTSDTQLSAPPLPRIQAASPAPSPVPDLQHRTGWEAGAPEAPLGTVPAPDALRDIGARPISHAGKADSTSVPVADSPELRALVRVPARRRPRTDRHDGNDDAVFTRPVVRPSNLGPTLPELRRALESAAVRPRPPSADGASAPAPLVPIFAPVTMGGGPPYPPAQPAPSGARRAAWPGYEDASGPPSAAGRARSVFPVMGTALPAPSPGERSAAPRRESPEAPAGNEPRIDVESIVDQVQRRLMKQLAVERERRGARR